MIEFACGLIVGGIIGVCAMAVLSFSRGDEHE